MPDLAERIPVILGQDIHPFHELLISPFFLQIANDQFNNGIQHGHGPSFNCLIFDATNSHFSQNF
ncbi:hypothetical protein D3C81_2109930 [compost metagenome]